MAVSLSLCIHYFPVSSKLNHYVCTNKKSLLSEKKNGKEFPNTQPDCYVVYARTRLSYAKNQLGNTFRCGDPKEPTKVVRIFTGKFSRKKHKLKTVYCTFRVMHPRTKFVQLISPSVRVNTLLIRERSAKSVYGSAKNMRYIEGRR